MVWLRWPPVECGHQVAVSGSGGYEFVVAVLEVLPAVEQLLFEVDQPRSQCWAVVGFGESSGPEFGGCPDAFAIA
jgi:hypothetical protein